MAFSRTVFTVLLLSVACNASVVPVFLWGDLAKLPSKSYPLQTTTTDEFGNILAKELAQQPFTVAFIEKTLSVEDLSRKNGDGETAFPFLHNNLGDGLYLPSVSDPLLALDSLANPEEIDHVKLIEDSLPAEIKPGTSKFLYIDLEDAKDGESRFDLLRRHNDFMASIFTKLQAQYPNLIAIYTAENPSWVIPEEHLRYRRQAAENSSSTINVDGLLFYAKTIQIQEGTNNIKVEGLSSTSTSYNETLGTQNTTLNYGNNILVLNFKKAAGYWFFESATVTSSGTTQTLFPELEVYSQVDFSYRCAPTVTFSAGNGTKSLNFDDLKIQPFFADNTTRAFGDSYNCVGFFSAPIWAGLFVTFILLSITFYGIMMMLDIRTMDRFDDPKGKTITINTVE